MATNCPDYDFRKIEPYWQEYWDKHKTFQAEPRSEKPKCFVLDMFPYPSGAGLHVGHPLGYVATDIFARFKRMRGFNVLHTMGFDAFGLPAEQYAIEHGIHPSVSTNRNIESMLSQLNRLGMDHEKKRRVATTDPEFYRWTQWIFVQLFNSYFDPFDHKARPVSDLIALLEAGDYLADTEAGAIVKKGAAHGRSWASLSKSDQNAFIASQRLAYMSDLPVNWCPALGTVLANEEVTNEGRSERGNFPVFKRPLRQWMLRITTYAERLLEDLSLVDWPEPIKMMQRNWIGRSEGAEILFEIEAPKTEPLRVFTTRPDTLFGATYMVLAPEHPLVKQITSDSQRDKVESYIAKAAAKSDLERTDLAKEKSGVFTGGFAVHPINGNRIPIWVADYVLMSYGTGAIMAVPAHDQRDYDFAQQYEIPVIQVIEPQDYSQNGSTPTLPFIAEGRLIHSDDFSGLTSEEGRARITEYLESRGRGHASVQYKLRDWLFSRQRYWGEPFPILHGEDGSIETVDESELPVQLPPMDDFRPQSYSDPDTPPTPPLGRAPESWRTVVRNGKVYHRELNTMPQWAGSCWYYLRYIDPANSERFIDPELERYWMGKNGVDLYVGGAEHAVLHLLYARFWHKILFDLGHVSTAEPFGKLFNQGYIQAAAFIDERGLYVPATEVEERDGKFYYQDKEVRREFGKMGKSLKNAVTPDEVCENYGADTLRLYLMFLGPLEAMKPWSSHGIEGVHRFLRKIWRELITENGGISAKVADAPEASAETLRLLHETIRKVTEDVEAMRFNTAISQMMIFSNHLQKVETIGRDAAEAFIRLLAPFAPHFAEDVWSRFGHDKSLAQEPWPTFDPSKLVSDEVKLVVQVNGKYRGDLMTSRDSTQEQAVALAKDNERVAPHLDGKTIRKVIYVPGRIINFVVG